VSAGLHVQVRVRCIFGFAICVMPRAMLFHGNIALMFQNSAQLSPALPDIPPDNNGPPENILLAR
jgi:hypothetical protein